MDARTELAQLLAVRSLTFGEFTLSSGKRADFYIDARLTTMSPEGLRLVGRAGMRAIRERGWRPDAIGGLTLGADPVSYAIALTSSLDDGTPLRAFSVRKDAKTHGTRKRIEGPVRDGDRVVIIEDVITTGASALTAAAAAEEANMIVIGVLGVLDREEGGRPAIEAKGYELIALSTAAEVLGFARGANHAR